MTHRVILMIDTILNLLKISQKVLITGLSHQLFHQDPGIYKFFLSTSLTLEENNMSITAPTLPRLLSTLQILRPTTLTCILQETKTTQTTPKEANLLKDKMAQTQVSLHHPTPQTALLRPGHQVLLPKAVVMEGQLALLRPQPPLQALRLQVPQAALHQILRLQAVEADHHKASKVSKDHLQEQMVV